MNEKSYCEKVLAIRAHKLSSAEELKQLEAMLSTEGLQETNLG